MRRTATMMGTGLLVALLAAGCDDRPVAVETGGGLFGPNAAAGPAVGLPPGVDPGAEPGGALGDVEVVGGWMEGSLGDVQGFSADLAEVNRWGGGLEIVAAGEGWGAMLLFSVSGSLEAPRIQGGIGCSGPQVGRYNWDEPMVRAEVAYTPPAVEGEPGTLDLVMDFPDGDTASAALAVRETP